MFGDLIEFMNEPDKFRATWQNGELYLDRNPRVHVVSPPPVPTQPTPALAHAS